MAFIVAVDPKYQIGALVKHRSNARVTMVIVEPVFERLPPRRTVFGIYAERKNALFQGRYLCEWMDDDGKHEDVFHQDALDLAA